MKRYSPTAQSLTGQNGHNDIEMLISLIFKMTDTTEEQLQIPQAKRPRKTKKSKKKDAEPTGVKTEAIKTKREHIMTPLRIKAFQACVEARKESIRKKREAAALLLSNPPPQGAAADEQQEESTPSPNSDEVDDELVVDV